MFYLKESASKRKERNNPIDIYIIKTNRYAMITNSSVHAWNLSLGNHSYTYSTKNEYINSEES